MTACLLTKERPGQRTSQQAFACRLCPPFGPACLQVASVSHRVLVLPDLPCETAWIHPPETLRAGTDGVNRTVCLAPTFWHVPDRSVPRRSKQRMPRHPFARQGGAAPLLRCRFPFPMPVPVDGQGQLVGGWARKSRRLQQHHHQRAGRARPVLLAPSWDGQPTEEDVVAVAGRRRRLAGSGNASAAAPSWWAQQRFVAAVPQLWDEPCTGGALLPIASQTAFGLRRVLERHVREHCICSRRHAQHHRPRVLPLAQAHGGGPARQVRRLPLQHGAAPGRQGQAPGPPPAPRLGPGHRQGPGATGRGGAALPGARMVLVGRAGARTVGYTRVAQRLRERATKRGSLPQRNKQGAALAPPCEHAQVAVPSGDVARALQRVADEALVYLGHPVTVVSGPPEATTATSSRKHGRRSQASAADGSDSGQHQARRRDAAEAAGPGGQLGDGRHPHGHGKTRPTPGEMLRRVNDRMAKHKCRAVRVREAAESGARLWSVLLRQRAAS